MSGDKIVGTEGPAKARNNEANNWGFETDSQVGLVAGRMYGANVATVREVVASYDIGADRLRRTLAATRSEADRSAAILIFALAEDLMISGLRQHLPGNVKGGWEEIASGNGLLATASDRISLLALLGWIHPEVYADLRVLKTIRNRFAHHPDVIGFSDSKIRSSIATLAPHEKHPIEVITGVAHKSLTPRQLYMLRSGGLIIRLVANLAVAPTARQLNVAPGHIDMVPWSELPPNLQELMQISAEHLVAIVQKSSDTGLSQSLS